MFAFDCSLGFLGFFKLHFYVSCLEERRERTYSMQVASKAAKIFYHFSSKEAQSLC